MEDMTKPGQPDHCDHGEIAKEGPARGRQRAIDDIRARSPSQVSGDGPEQAQRPRELD
jgi:hypothetical protein